jgi:ferritin-like metal-binding protein YciE
MARHNGSSSDILVAWLRDAYAMEKAMIPVLENHAKDAERFPELQQQLQQHVVQTQRHADRVAECLRQLGEEPSTFKNTVARVMGAVQSVATGAFHDEIVKNALQDYGSESFEIACYKALIEGARGTGNQEIVRVCEEILREEEAMLRFLEQSLPTAVHDVLPVAV